MLASTAIGHIYALAWFATRESMPYALYEIQQETADRIAGDICDAIGCDRRDLEAEAEASRRAATHSTPQL